DVDDAAADGELAALLDPVGCLVAGERELLAEGLETRLVADLQLDRRRAGGRRRDRLGKRRRRRADEPAAGEQVERPGALADEVRRRRKTGFPAHAAARQEGDVVRADEPGGGLGRVAGVGVVRQNADERTTELRVQRREKERQRRLGDACRRRKRVY